MLGTNARRVRRNPQTMQTRVPSQPPTHRANRSDEIVVALVHKRTSPSSTQVLAASFRMSVIPPHAESF
jgi:hypothetical protein